MRKHYCLTLHSFWFGGFLHWKSFLTQPQNDLHLLPGSNQTTFTYPSDHYSCVHQSLISQAQNKYKYFFHSKHLLLVRVHALCGWAMNLNVFKASAHFLLNLFVLLLSFADTVEAEERGDLILKRTKDLGKTFTIIHEDIYSFGYIGAFLFFSVMEDPVRWLDHYLYTSVYRVVYIPSIYIM